MDNPRPTFPIDVHCPYPDLRKVHRDLPIRQIKTGDRIAVLNLRGDWQLCEALGYAMTEIVKTLPPSSALVMPGGKAECLLHVVGRNLSLPTVVLPKEYKEYMGDALSVNVKSITTDRVQTLYLPEDDARLLADSTWIFVDDVISTGASLVAADELLEKVKARRVGGVVGYTEGNSPWHDAVKAYGHLPLNP